MMKFIWEIFGTVIVVLILIGVGVLIGSFAFINRSVFNYINSEAMKTINEQGAKCVEREIEYRKYLEMKHRFE